MKRKPFTLLIHIALVVILTGALCTHFFGIQGEVTIDDNSQTSVFTKTSGPGKGVFPFSVSLVSADVEFYPGTTTPMDFKSVLRVNDMDYKVSMNNPALIDSWRFYQSGMSAEGSTFSISHDPWGIAITYIGYVMLTVGLIGFFFQKKTAWRTLTKRAGVMAALTFCCSAGADAKDLPAMQRPLAADMGKVYVYWNDRICPMNTMAKDVTVKLYGSDTYKDMTAEQVLSGWLFYFDEWYSDYAISNSEIKYADIDKSKKKILERKSLITIMGTGEAFKIYPYKTSEGFTEWLSLTGHRPSQMSLEQWQFMQTTMPHIKELLLQGKNIRADEEIKLLIEGQKRYAGKDFMPSGAKVEAEIIYNRNVKPIYGGITAALLGAVFLFFSLSCRKLKRITVILSTICLYLLTIAVICIVIVSWWLSGHIPLSNGTEMMLCMAAVPLMISLAVSDNLVRGALVLVSAMALMVAGMASKTPRIGSLMPVLASHLLSVHVMVIMCAYVMFLLMAVLSTIALLCHDQSRRIELARFNRIILTPSVASLAIGIMIGAVWANQSWGRYWGWDPKETCALIMLLVYSLPLHWGVAKLSCFRRPIFFHRYILLALLTVIFTYFGANFLIPGLHSYA